MCRPKHSTTDLASEQRCHPPSHFCLNHPPKSHLTPPRPQPPSLPAPHHLWLRWADYFRMPMPPTQAAHGPNPGLGNIQARVSSPSPRLQPISRPFLAPFLAHFSSISLPLAEGWQKTARICVGVETLSSSYKFGMFTWGKEASSLEGQEIQRQGS